MTLGTWTFSISLCLPAPISHRPLAILAYSFSQKVAPFLICSWVLLLCDHWFIFLYMLTKLPLPGS
jgi:hypothetical protein